MLKRIKAKRLFEALSKLLFSYGLTKKKSNRVSSLLVNADLSGQGSHGVARIPIYLDKLEKGHLKVNVKTKIISQTATTASLDGNWGFGQLAADDAIKICIKKALKNNVSCITLKRANHIGRLADFTNQAAKKNLICIAFSNLHGTSHIVSPFGGIDRKLPTNPIAISTPGPKKDLFEMDLSTSSIAEGKVKINHFLRKKMEKGFLLNYFGKTTLSPKDLYTEPKASILPLGGLAGHKGYALALAVDVLGGALSKAGCSSNKKNQHGNAVTFIAIKIKPFTSIKMFKNNLNDLYKHVKSSRLQKGFKKILVPGEYERESRKIFDKKGILLDNVTINNLNQLFKKQNLNFSF